MDPYLEDPGGWGGVHDALISLMHEHLTRDLGPGFIAAGDTRVYVISPDEQRWIFPDVYIIETPAPPARAAGRGAIAAPCLCRTGPCPSEGAPGCPAPAPPPAVIAPTIPYGA